ncbi:carboxylesterase family protein [Stieleria marina]|uniref:carboxylesterase family protein n=1 Tax=Stieleria marina TaxID=1930275 RepID=UPI003AF39D55
MTANSQAERVVDRATFEVLVTRGVPYAQGMIYHPTDPSRCYPRNLTLDIYQPQQKAAPGRPVVLLVHSGGFWTGDSLMRSMVRAGHYFASRGWVCFSINYRLHGDRAIAPDGWPANHPTYAATRDAKAAIRWIRAHAAQYNLDTDTIIAYGGSAGGYIGTALAASDEADFRDELLVNDKERPLLEATHLDQSSKVQAVVNHWGSGLLLDLLKRYDGRERFDNEDAPLLVVHGTDDKVVPYDHAEALLKNYQAELLHFKLDGFGHSAWNAKVDGKSLLDAVYPFMRKALRNQAK